jgi:dTDP-4-amino-4,6-dideoxygalactose transaminase
MRYRSLLADVEGIFVPFEDGEVATSSCYVFPIMLEEDGRQSEVSGRMRERGIQTSIFYPSIHRFTAYRERFPGVSLPITERASRTELTLPFYPHMSFDDQDRVVSVLAEALAHPMKGDGR